ncbi:hypothetical protein R6Q59_017358 [Mikania micrantha]
METLTTSSPEKEIPKKSIDCEMVKCVTLAVKEALEYENWSEIVENESVIGCGDDTKIVSGDENMNPSSMVLNNSLDDSENSTDDETAKEKVKAGKMMVFLQEECIKKDVDDSNAIDENEECEPGNNRRKTGRRKKVMESSECIRDTISKKVKADKDGLKVTSRVLRSRTMAMSGSAKVEESKLNESVVGFKRQMEAECFNQTEFLKEVNEGNQLLCIPQKKQKRRGRPPKVQGETACFDQTEFLKKVNESSQLMCSPKKKQKRRGRPPKVQGDAGSRKIRDDCFDQIDIKKQVNERSTFVGRPQKKRKRRGRPPKMQSEIGLKSRMKDECFGQVDIQKEVNEHSQLTGIQQQKTEMKNHKDKVIKNLKDRGRPPKMQAENFSTNTEQPSSNLLNTEDIKKGPKIQHMQNQVQESEITGVNEQKVKISEESNDHITVKETLKGDNTKQLNSVTGREDRRKKQQLIRDQIVSMIMKAGWTIEYRPRQGREYLDSVYVDQKGRTHWSITKAYFSLKKKIDKGDADAKEISAFTTIPVEEMNILFRIVSKIRSDKNMKKNKRGKKISKAEIVISGEAQLMEIHNKKGKAGKKRKKVVTLANKLSNVKVKKDKVGHERRVSAESAAQKQSKASKKGRHNRKPCLVARSSSKGLDQDNDDSAMYTGKRNIFSWMIDSGVIMPGGKLLYREGRRNTCLEGQVTCDGIHCRCCNEVMDLSNFVTHGEGKVDQALKNVYYQSGVSLLTCLLESWSKEVRVTNIRFNHVDVMGDDPNDDTCNICGDGGDLICCDGCPSTFHQRCLDIQNFPSGEWHCLYCCCKFCELVACDDSHHVPNSEMTTCSLCEEKFHHLCLQEEETINVGSAGLSFCGRKCRELYEQLQTYIGVKLELQDGYSWTLLKCYDGSQYLDDPVKVECNSKLAVAFSVMDECFVPIMDERSGVNKIHNVVYNCGSNFRRLDYSGFFTAVLEKGGELISAASIRIHGNRLAEMPFIGTRNMYRRQGMCRRLLDAIEDALCSLGVDELAIPAIPELYKTWTKVFGFKPLEESLRQAIKGMSLIVFPGTDILHKPLLKNQIADKNLTPVAGDNTVECITVEKDDNALSSEQTLATHLESETPFLPSDNEHKSIGLVNNDATDVKLSCLTSEIVPKNRFDLNLQPVATDTDIQSIDDDSFFKGPASMQKPV